MLPLGGVQCGQLLHVALGCGCINENAADDGGCACTQYIIENGIDTEADYPYKAEDGSCDRRKERRIVVTIDAIEDVPPRNETALMQVGTLRFLAPLPLCSSVPWPVIVLVVLAAQGIHWRRASIKVTQRAKVAMAPVILHNGRSVGVAAFPA